MFHRAGAVAALVEDEWDKAIAFKYDVVEREHVACGLACQRRVDCAYLRRARNHRDGFADNFVCEARAVRGITQRVNRFKQFADAIACASAQERPIFRDNERERIGAQCAFRQFEIGHSGGEFTTARE